ncbi:MAG TPA: DUF934 domain-containing protein [Casimicrobiaceae bacterium]|nr:DUF934 domain-containing protein [Casimicrobiaceae bacterium]
MPLLTKDRAVIDDRWILLPETAAIADVPVLTPAIVPLALWSAQHAALAARDDIGVWLKPADDPDALGADVVRLPLIAVDFPKFSDGRGYSTARLLREKYRYTGELRAIGDILRDQLYYLRQCGFDTFALQPGRSVADALAAFGDFSDNYQATVAQPVPLFRRRLQGAAADVSASREGSRR